MLALPFKKKERKRKTKHKEKEKEDRERGGGKEKGNDREKERRKERKVRGRVETPLICELGTSGLEILAFPRYPIAFFVFLFFSFFKRDSRRESSLVPNHALSDERRRRRHRNRGRSRERRDALEIRLAACTANGRTTIRR